MTLDSIDVKSILSHFVQGLQVNTCLTKLTISPHSVLNNSQLNIALVKLDIIKLALLNTTLQFIELHTVCMQFPMKLVSVLEALRENNTVKHLTLYLYVPPQFTTLSIPRETLISYTVTTEEAEAVGNVLAKNKTLEVFHLIAEIIECSPIVRGLLKNKTLKEFGTSKNTKKNIITCPKYVDVRRKIVFMGDRFYY